MTPSVLIVWNFLARAWSVIGPLAGVCIGAWLSRSWQRKQWVLESKKGEWRELISCLSQSAHFILNNSPHLIGPGGMGGLKSGEQERQSDEAIDRGHTVIADRIFIADIMEREKIGDRWLAVVKHRDVNKFWSGWTELHRVLLKAARSGLGLKEKL
jgi:hypothetical protein